MSTNLGDCFFLQGAAGDQGIHDGKGVWWLSQDVRLYDPEHEYEASVEAR